MRMVEKMRRKVLCMLLAFVVAVSSANVNIMAAESRGSMGFGIGDSPVGEQSELSGTQREVTEEGTGDSGISDKALDGETEAPGTEDKASGGETEDPDTENNAPDEGTGDSDTGDKVPGEETEDSDMEDKTPDEGTEDSDTEDKTPGEGTEGSDTEDQAPDGETEDPDTENIDSEQETDNPNSEEDKTGAEDQDINEMPEEPEDDRQSLSVYGLADHEVAEEFARGSGTVDDPYLIGTIEELNLFSQEAPKSINKYYKLSSDIRLNDNLENPTSSWVPIENFRGHLDGNNHRIENLYIHLESVDTNIYRQDIGLLSYAASSASISDLTVENALFELDVQEITRSASLDMGVLVGESYAEIDRCTVRGSVTMRNLNPLQGMNVTTIGGIVGLNGGTVSDSTMKAMLECAGEINTNYANTGIGGIAGTNRKTLKYCTNSGQITMEQGAAAGIAYYVYDVASVIQACHNVAEASVTSFTGDAAGIAVRGKGKIENCHNEGTVKAAAEKQTAAGIAASFSNGIMVECINEGTLEGTGKLAGIVGTAGQSDADGITITRCENRADLTVESTTWNGYLSGVVGEISCGGNDTGTVRISLCSNTGSLSGVEVGGIVGSIENKEAEVHIEQCHNDGVIEATASAAGIVRDVNYSSEHQGTTAINGCYNLGEISVSGEGGQYAAGIAGSVNYAVIGQCYNAGRIRSDKVAAGIASSIGFWGDVMSVRVVSCFNLGEIAAGGTGAGIIATLSGGTVSTCYNMGKIISSVEADDSKTGQTIGGIAGESSLNKTVNSGEAIIENCFNCGIIAVENAQADKAGGIIGDIFASGEGTSLTMKHCYNVGKLEHDATKKGYYGAIAGCAAEYDQGKIQAQKLYYLEDGESAVDSYNHEYKLPDTVACTIDQMTQVSTYTDWDFDTIWKKGNRKYQFPILQGVGENYLVYHYGGIGEETAFGEYILQAADQDSGIGVSRAVFSYQGRTVKADSNGRIRILAADPALGTVSVTRSGYHGAREEVKLTYGVVNIIRMERKKEIKMPRMSMNASPHIEAGETTVEGDTANALDVQEFPIKIDLKFNNKTGEEEGDNGGGFKDSIPVKITWENGENGEDKTKAKISIGSKTKYTKYDDYEYIKSLLEKWKSEQSEDVLKEMKSMDTRKISGKFGAESLSIYVSGYITIDFASGTPQIIESGMVIGAEGEGSLTVRPVWAGTVAYGEFRLNVEGSGSFNITFNEELGYFDFASTLSLGISGTVCVGIGYDFAKGEVGATGSLEGSVNIKKNWKLKEDLSLKAAMVPYALLKVGFFTIKTSYEGWNVDIWPPKQAKGIQVQQAADASYYISDRDYLTDHAAGRRPYAETGEGADALTSLDMDNVYPEGDPQICVTADGTRVAVWIADDGSKASADRTTLYYAVIRDDVITDSGAVWETGRGDYSPTLLAKGDRVYLAWLNADRQYGDSTTLEEFCGNLSLYLSVFNGTGFEEPVRITEEDNHLPLLADLCSDGDGVTVTWVENSANNAFLAEGANTVYSRQYQGGTLDDRQTLSESLPYLYGLDSGYVNGSYTAAWSQDTDGDLTTGEDADIYLYKDGSVSRLTDNGMEDSYVQFLGDDLYWCSGGVIRKMTQLDVKSSESLGILCGDAFQVIQGAAGKAVVWLENDGFVTIPMISYEKGGVFTKAIPLANFAQVNISGYGAVYEDDGSVSLFYDVKEVLDQWTDSPYGQTNMRYTKELIPSDLLVDDFLYYDAMDTAPGESLHFRTEVTNHTGVQIDTLHLVLRSGEEILKEEDSVAQLPVGGTAAATMEYRLPQDFVIGDYTLTVTGTGVAENDLSNNSASAQVGYGNAALQDCSIDGQEDGTVVISGTAVNEGYQDISGKTLYVRAGGQDGEVIGQIENISLSVGESLPFSLPVGQEYTDFTHVYDVDYFYVSVEGDGKETNYADNSEVLMLRPVWAERVEAEADFQMDLGTSRKLAVSVMPQNAYGGCIYTSSDLSVASVNQEGVITAYGIGQTDISVITEDGQAADTCKVTVTAGSETTEGAEYSMSESVLSLDAGKEEVLYVYADGQEGAVTEPVVLTWRSSDESVVSVTAETLATGGGNGDNTSAGEAGDTGTEGSGNDSGESGSEEDAAAACRVKALKEGSAVVTGVSENGGAVFCIVTVQDQGIKAVSFTQTEYEMQKGQTQKLTWESRPEGASASDFTFRSSDETVVTVDSEGQVTALEQGSANVEMVYRGAAAGQEEQTGQGAEPSEEVRAVCMIEVTDPALTVYSVTFDTNGGSSLAESVAFQSGAAGYAFILPEPPSRPGYIFNGWNDRSDGSGTSYGSNGTLIAGTDVVGDLVLYAVWLPERDGMWAADVPDQVYTGGKILPKITVYDGTRTLTEGQDYTLVYKNNVKAALAIDGAKAPAVVVKGKGNYAGSQTVNFNILPRDIGTDEEIDAPALLKKANNKVQKPVPVVTRNGKKLANKRDFTVEYPDLFESAGAYKEAGDYRIIVKGTGNYTGERTVPYTITSNELISKATVKGIKNKPYTGQEIKQEFTVKYGKKELAEGVDYTTAYADNTKIGTASVIITGIGAYSGTKKVTFKIIGGSIKKAKVTGIPKTMTYTGSALTTESPFWGVSPVLTMTVNKEQKVLTEGTDYTVSYLKNVDAGTASVIFTGVNGYSGTLKKNFKILPYAINTDADGKMSVQMEDNPVPYMKGGSKPKPVVTYDGQLLTEGKDYTLSYRNNKKADDGTNPDKRPTVTVKGKGNFKGTIQQTFTIGQQDLGLMSMTVPDRVYRNKKNAYKTTPKITDLNGSVLKAGTDYEKNFTYVYTEEVLLEDGSVRRAGDTAESDDILPAGTVLEITVSGKGNYTGQLKGRYRIVWSDISKAKITIPAQIYTGEEIRPGQDVLQVKLGGVSLWETDYEIVEYRNNIKKGKASVTIKGIGNYGGTKTVQFTIRPKTIFWW